MCVLLLTIKINSSKDLFNIIVITFIGHTTHRTKKREYEIWIENFVVLPAACNTKNLSTCHTIFLCHCTSQLQELKDPFFNVIPFFQIAFLTFRAFLLSRKIWKEHRFKMISKYSKENKKWPFYVITFHRMNINPFAIAFSHTHTHTQMCI